MDRVRGISRHRFLRLAAVASAAALLPFRGESAREKMFERLVPSSGERVPVVGLGTWQAFDVGPDADDRARLARVVDAFFDSGGRVIDSSPMYGRAEQTVGDLLTERDGGSDPFIATKVWTRGREDGIRQMARSAERLGRPRIDLMQVHNLLDWRVHLATLRAWKNEGKIRYFGVTHYTSDALDEIAGLVETEALDFVQIAYSVTVRDAERRLLPTAADNGTAVIVNRPFEGGGIFRTVRKRPLPGWAAEFECESWSQVFLKYLLGHPAVTCVIPGTGNPRHMNDNVRAGFGSLPDGLTRRRMAQYFDDL